MALYFYDQPGKPVMPISIEGTAAIQLYAEVAQAGGPEHPDLYRVPASLGPKAILGAIREVEALPTIIAPISKLA